MTLFGLLIACGSDYDVKEGSPQLAVGVTDIDFGEVVLYQQSTIALSITNTGMAPLNIAGLPFSLPHPAFQVLNYPQTVDSGGTAVIDIRFAPVVEEASFATLQLLSNDPTRPSFDIYLSGDGVQPLIDVEPRSIDFGVVTEGQTKSSSVSISATGTGTLRITDTTFSDASVTGQWPQGMGLPIELESGLAISFMINYTASDGNPFSGFVDLTSNDPTSPLVRVELGANGGGSGDNQPPDIEILNPPSGWQTTMGSTIPMEATLTDDQDALDSIPVLVYWNGSVIDTLFTDSQGRLNTTVQLNTVAEADVLTLRAIDSLGAIDEDSISLSVVDPNEPMPYILSGGPDLFHFWSVDDDVEIYVDGHLVFSDTDGTQNDHPPVAFFAQPGSLVRLLATDQNYCDQLLGPLVLHFGMGQSQPVWDGVCVSACAESSCYDESFSGPWPTIFVDQTVTVELP